MAKFFILYVLLVFSAGCNKVDNHFDENTLECGYYDQKQFAAIKALSPQKFDDSFKVVSEKSIDLEFKLSPKKCLLVQLQQENLTHKVYVGSTARRLGSRVTLKKNAITRVSFERIEDDFKKWSICGHFQNRHEKHKDETYQIFKMGDKPIPGIKILSTKDRKGKTIEFSSRGCFLVSRSSILKNSPLLLSSNTGRFATLKENTDRIVEIKFEKTHAIEVVQRCGEYDASYFYFDRSYPEISGYYVTKTGHKKPIYQSRLGCPKIPNLAKRAYFKIKSENKIHVGESDLDEVLIKSHKVLPLPNFSILRNTIEVWNDCGIAAEDDGTFTYIRNPNTINLTSKQGLNRSFKITSRGCAYLDKSEGIYLGMDSDSILFADLNKTKQKGGFLTFEHFAYDGSCNDEGILQVLTYEAAITEKKCLPRIERKFLDYCLASRNLTKISSDFMKQAKHTVDQVMLKLKASDCEDANRKLSLKEGIRLDGLGLSNIYPLGSLSSLRVLSLANNEISDITPLSTLKNLESLKLRKNRISRLVGLESLEKIAKLDASNNRIDSIESLRNLQSLKYLNLAYNKISSPDALGDLKNLKTLYMGYNKIKSIESIADLTNLIKLGVSSNPIIDIELLRNLNKLKRLSAFFLEIKDISFLINLSDLEYLSIYSNNISDIAPLYHLKKLKKLNIGNNQISDASYLANLTQIVDLSIISNPISDFGFLGSLHKIETLEADNCHIDDLTPLMNLQALRKLSLRGNRLVDVSKISGLKSLKSLDLSMNLLTKVPELKAIDKLENLRVQNNQLTDLCFAAGGTRLKKLEASFNSISSLDCLKGLENLMSFWISYNPVSNISSVKSFKKLETLAISGTRIEMLDGFPISLAYFRANYSFLRSLRSIPEGSKLVKINIAGSHLSNLKGLENAKDLQEIDVHGNRINDISSLEKLTNISVADFGDNLIESVKSPTICPINAKSDPVRSFCNRF